jgi:FkbM family methyltransferase
MLRSLLEKASRRTVFRRSLPENVGGAQIYVSGSAGLKYLFKRMTAIDPILCQLAQEFIRPGNVVWDIGANVGLFSFAAAHLAGNAGKIFAFDADTWLVALLRRSSTIQPGTSAPVEIVPAAIASSPVELRTFNVAVRSRASNALQGYGYVNAGGVSEQQTVVCLSMDWLAERLPLPDVIKIDVEGAELEVLQGARGLLQRCNPVIICEVGSENSRQVGDFLREAGYSLFDGDTEPPRLKLEIASWNTVAIRAPDV